MAMAGARRASRRRYVLLRHRADGGHAHHARHPQRAVRARSAPSAGARTRSWSPDPGARSSDVARPVGDWWDGVTDAGDIKRREPQAARSRSRRSRASERAAQQAIDENETLKQLLGLNSIYDVQARERARSSAAIPATSRRRSRSTRAPRAASRSTCRSSRPTVRSSVA